MEERYPGDRRFGIAGKGSYSMSDLRSLPNIGPKLVQQLSDVGIDSAEELKSVGSREAWLRLLSHDPSA